jgi:predicted TIM-barrel fold metal-dependent hydrolase
MHPVMAPSENDLFGVSRDLLLTNKPQIANRMQKSGIERSILVLFQPDALDKTDVASGSSFVFSVLAEFRGVGAADRLAEYARKGVKSITFHPYLQNIVRSDWPQALAFAVEAERLGLFISVCTAYGSAKIYALEVLAFAAELAGSVACPVIFAHCGGAKIIDAMLIADAHPNVFLETSFSLSYWLGSSIEQDIAFAMRKLGAKRWLFGSDSPFVDMDQALSDHIDFFERHRFSKMEIEAIMGSNALKLLED